MIYSARHRQSLFESFLNLLPSVGSVLLGLWIAFTGSFIPPATGPVELAAWVVASLIFATVVHELAHLVTGMLAGRQVRKILIGSGGTIFTTRLGPTRIQVCSNLLGGGAVMVSALDDPSRGGLVAAIAAGPTVNLLAGFVALAGLNAGPPWLGTFALLNLLLGVTNFIPSRFSARGQESVTDGLQILRLLRGRPLRTTFFEGDEMAPDAQRAGIGAIEEARDAGSDEVTEVHLLAALNSDADIRALLAPAAVDELIRWRGPADSDDHHPVRTPVTDAISKVSFQVARDAGISRPNAACLCLALMAVPSPVATRLKDAGVSETALGRLAQARAEPAQGFQPEGSLLPDLPLERWGSAADRALEMAFRIATADRAEETGTQHVLAALAHDLHSRAGRALWQLGFALTRNGKLVARRDPPSAPPPLSPQAQTALAGALLRTGPTYPTGTGELCLGVADQGRGMGGLLFVQADVTSDALVAALRSLPREQSDPVGYTASIRKMWELRAGARLGAGRFADSLADFRVLEQHATTDEMLAISRNNIAYTALLTGDPALRAEALEKSKAALAFRPDQRSFRGTHAFALLENGSIAEAAEILQDVAIDHPRPRDRALDLCLLAVCRARLGDVDAAKRHVAAAEEADPRCMLLDRARAELGQPAPAPA